MSKYINEINYEKLVEKSLKHVIIDALKIASSQGLPGEHHYYITFKTNHPKVKISDYLKSQYPNEMTIVIQHQFSNLIINDIFFSIGLSFSGIMQALEIPYEAVSYFGDPHAKFGLSFDVNDEDSSLDDISFMEDKNFIEEKPQKVSGSASVVSIDSFRKK